MSSAAQGGSCGGPERINGGDVAGIDDDTLPRSLKLVAPHDQQPSPDGPDPEQPTT